MGSLQPYSYTKFEEGDSNVIRLLQIEAGDPGEKVKGKLVNATFKNDGSYGETSPVHIDNKPVEYEAVSWAWGNQNRDDEIEIRDEEGTRWTFAVPRKLNSGLKALRNVTTPRTVWVDLVCINQDDVYEKSHQVPLMDKIYSHAKRVCVWLGPDGGDNSSSSMKKALRFIETLYKDLNYENTIKSSVDAGTIVDDIKALRSLMWRDWFSRRWVIQEIALAKEATIFYGEQSMDWKIFAQAIELFVMGESKTRLADDVMYRDAHTPNFWDNVSASGAALLVEAVSKLYRRHARQQHKPEPLMSLEETVCQLESFETSKAHDTIYAFLAIAKDTAPVAHADTNDKKIQEDIKKRLIQTLQEKQVAKPFHVDYKKPYSEVCCQFLHFAITQNPDRKTALNVLCRPWAFEPKKGTDSVDLDVPKWATSLESARFETKPDETDDSVGLYRRNGNPFVNLPPTGLYKAAGELPVDDQVFRYRALHLPDKDGNMAKGRQIHSLFVSGFVLDTIEVVKDKITTGAVVPYEWLRLGGWDDFDNEPPDELWRTLVADRGPNGVNCPLFYPAACRKALSLSSSIRNIDAESTASNRKHYKSAVADFCRRLQEVVVGRKLIRTRSKNLGLVSGREVGSPLGQEDASSIQKGDLICILYGCSVPVVLKKVPKSDDDRLAQKNWAAKLVQRRWRSRKPSGSRKRPKDEETLDEAQDGGAAPQQANAKRRRLNNGDIPIIKQAGPLEGLSSRQKASLNLLEDDYYYEFWGECYIHGMMSGEAISLLRKQRSEGDRPVNQIFELR